MIGLPYPSSLAVRAVAVVLVAAVGAIGGWTVQGWRQGAHVAEVKLDAADRESAAVSASLARYKVIRDAHDHEAASLAAIDAQASAELTRLQHENEALRGRVAAGTVRLRVAAHCPAPGTADVPAPGTRGSVDTGTGVELDATARPAYFDLRESLDRAGRKLAACQQSLGCVTGQLACPAPESPR